MICWISSFPRSGNTLTRQILKESFGIKTYTHFLHEPETDHLFPDQHKFDWQDYELYRSLKTSNEVYFVKTHYATFDGCPCIHVVRNGRDAMASFAKLKNIPIECAIVTQMHDFPGWSSHFWAHYGRLNSLTLKFEDMLEDPNVAAEAIGKFINKTPMPFVNSFSPINRVMGSGGKERGVFDKATEQLFQRCHGTVMGVMGYV